MCRQWQGSCSSLFNIYLSDMFQYDIQNIPENIPENNTPEPSPAGLICSSIGTQITSNRVNGLSTTFAVHSNNYTLFV